VIAWDELGSEMSWLGEGEFATAHKTVLDGRSAAVKRLKKAKSDTPTAVRGLKREIVLMTLMKHPNVLTGLGLGQVDGQPFMLLPLLESTLAQALPRDADAVPFWVRWRECKQWTLLRAVRCGLELAMALRHCHHDAFPGFRVLHRDIKPANCGFLADGTIADQHSNHHNHEPSRTASALSWTLGLTSSGATARRHTRLV